ncbi:hypothetical protein [Streptomyces roseirectus]|nr:hypothetical protein [Streptomyces roseirectus]
MTVEFTDGAVRAVTPAGRVDSREAGVSREDGQDNPHRIRKLTP